jgi:hypothetical protein
MTIATATKVCPRCSREIKGYLVHEDSDYFISCLHCGFVLVDRGYYRPSFHTLFAKFEKADPEPTPPPAPPPAPKPIVVPDKPPAPNLRPHIEMLLSKCCERHRTRRLSECDNCVKLFKKLEDEEAINEILRRLRK